MTPPPPTYSIMFAIRFFLIIWWMSCHWLTKKGVSHGVKSVVVEYWISQSPETFSKPESKPFKRLSHSKKNQLSSRVLLRIKKERNNQIKSNITRKRWRKEIRSQFAQCSHLALIVVVVANQSTNCIRSSLCVCVCGSLLKLISLTSGSSTRFCRRQTASGELPSSLAHP
jgi:ribonuclease P protein component